MKKSTECLRFQGTISKDGKFWLVEIPSLDLMTQGHSKKEAYEMAISLVEDAVGVSGLEVYLDKVGHDSFEIYSNKSSLIVAFMLRRQRQKNGLTVREASKLIGSSSPNAYGVYEQGKRIPTIEKLEELLMAMSAKAKVLLTV